MDDYPLHQIAEPIRHVATSDRNFYDRYYFNLHGCSDELFMVMGLGQYPNLAVQDAFAVVRRDDDHIVVRASRELGDRMDTSVGPFRVEVREGLRKLRFVVEDNEHGLAMDLEWEGAIPPYLEPRHFIRSHGRVMFDTQRFAQTGYWSGILRIGDEEIAVTPDRWWGTRDRSWGIRPVGESEPPGIQTGSHFFGGMWNYAPMQFDDFSILYIVQEDPQGRRSMEEAVRIWNDPSREPEHLGSPEHEHSFVPGTRDVASSVLRFFPPDAKPLEVRVTPLTHCYLMVGTGYGLDADWKHGMHQGPLAVQGLRLNMRDDVERMWGLVDQAARFETSEGDVGYGMHEYFFLGAHERYQFD